MTPGRSSRSAGGRVDDPGCAVVFEAMDRYVEAVLRGEAVDRSFARLILHLRDCLACREDTEGLVAAMEAEGRMPHPR